MTGTTMSAAKVRLEVMAISIVHAAERAHAPARQKEFGDAPTLGGRAGVDDV
ncbi:hypothetical protein [Sphingomonas sp.]|uniref:hypothetical protein n=1 Tax=Sphingomonas sp. TaxID=28214 RepID=UPI003B00DEE6